MDTNQAHQEESTSLAAGSSSTMKTWSPTASLINLILVVVAGVIAWYLMQTYCPDPEMMISEELQEVNAYSPEEMNVAKRQAIASANQQIAIGALAGMGGLLGIAFGLSGGLVQRSLARIVLAGVAVAILGAVGGGLGGWLGDLTYNAVKPAVGPITLAGTIVVEVVALGLLGGAIGIGVGLTLGVQQPTVESTVFGLLAGAVAGLLYLVTTAAVLPLVIAESLVPTDAKARLLWILMTAVCLGLILPMAGSRRTSRTPAKTD